MTFFSKLSDSLKAVLAGVGALATAFAAGATATVFLSGYDGLPEQVDRLEAQLNQPPPGLVARLESLEEWVPAWRYLICSKGSETRGADPAACESYLSPDLLDYLRPEGR